MSERIKRYMMIAESHTCSDGTPGAKVREAEHPIGAWCLSTDVAAIEAENARLLQIEERADTMREWIREHLKPPSHQANLSHNRQRLLDSLAAYDAAKAQETTK